MKKDFLNFIPSVAAIVVTIITVIVHATVSGGTQLTACLSSVVCMVFMTILPILNKYLRLNFPIYLIWLICIHVVISNSFGSVLGFYDKFYWWDLLAHGLFGLWATAVIYYLYEKFIDKPVSMFALVLIFLAVMGIAALWEVYEFVAGSIIGDDMQGVAESINAGKSPLYDTITDIAVAMAGIAIFYIVLLIKKLRTTKTEERAD